MNKFAFQSLINTLYGLRHIEFRAYKLRLVWPPVTGKKLTGQVKLRSVIINYGS